MIEKNNPSTKIFFKQFFCSRVFIALFFLVIGVAATLAAQRVAYSREKALVEKYNRDLRGIYDFENLSNEQDVLKKVAEIEKKMSKVFEANRKEMEQVLKKSYESKSPEGKSQMDKNPRGKASVVKNEDEQSYYYELSFSGFTKDEIDVVIKNNVLTFSAVSRNKVGGNSSASSFRYDFSLGEYDHMKEPEILREDSKIIVKIAKKNPSATR